MARSGLEKGQPMTWALINEKNVMSQTIYSIPGPFPQRRKMISNQDFPLIQRAILTFINYQVTLVNKAMTLMIPDTNKELKCNHSGENNDGLLRYLRINGFTSARKGQHWLSLQLTKVRWIVAEVHVSTAPFAFDNLIITTTRPV